MAKRKTTSNRRKGRTKAKSDGDRWVQRERWIAGGLLLIVLATGLAFVPTMRASLAPANVVREVRFHGAPTWAGDSLLRHLAETAMQADSSDVQCADRGTLCSVREAMEETGWFASVLQVRRASDGALVIEATFLAPTAIVQDRYGDAIVDAQGRLLPEGCRLDPEAHIITLVHPRVPRPVRARRIWESDDVHAALHLLEVIQGKDWAGQITSIDLGQFSRNGELVLLTDRGSRIIWGSKPGSETPLEALSNRKIVRLDHLYRNSGRVDQHHTGEIDLTDASVVVRR
jgi:hypothetical protein